MRNPLWIVIGSCIGTSLGVVIGVISGEIAISVAIGAALGCGLGSWRRCSRAGNDPRHGRTLISPMRAAAMSGKAAARLHSLAATWTQIRSTSSITLCRRGQIRNGVR